MSLGTKHSDPLEDGSASTCSILELTLRSYCFARHFPCFSLIATGNARRGTFDTFMPVDGSPVNDGLNRCSSLGSFRPNPPCHTRKERSSLIGLAVASHVYEYHYGELGYVQLQ